MFDDDIFAWWLHHEKKAIFWMMIFTMSLGAETTNSMAIFVFQ
jgi:hypothetical protein